MQQMQVQAPWELAAQPGLPGLPASPLRPLLPALRDAATIERLREHASGRIVTGCVYCRLPPATHGVLVARGPRFSGPHAHYADWWPGVAPSPRLEAALAAGRLTWTAFAARYRAELEHWPCGLLTLWRHLAALLEHAPTVTLLGLAPAAGGDERRATCAR